jgi:regulator of sigma E protease
VVSTGVFVAITMFLVAIHELAHLVVGRRLGIVPTVFSVGFGRTLWERADRTGLVWRLSALPLGGYVRFKGDDAPRGPEAPEPGTLDAASIPARMAMFAAGPAANLVLGALLFALAALPTAVERVPLTVGELLVADSGLRPGDEIVSVDGRVPDRGGDFRAFSMELPTADPHLYEVRRDTGIVTVRAPHPYPAIVAGAAPGRAAARGGLLPGDRIVDVNGQPIDRVSQLAAAAADSGGAALDLVVIRDGAQFVVRTRPDELSGDGGAPRFALGINGAPLFALELERIAPAAALARGFGEAGALATAALRGTWDLIAGRHGVCDLGGPVEIARLSGEAAMHGPVIVARLAAALSVLIAIMNLLPVPMLDGGRIVLLAVEAVWRKPVSDAAFRALMAGSLALLLALMLVATIGDVFC